MPRVNLLTLIFGIATSPSSTSMLLAMTIMSFGFTPTHRHPVTPIQFYYWLLDSGF